MYSRRQINAEGVVESNPVIFQFILPSLCAAIASAALQAVGETAVSVDGQINGSTSTLTYRKNR